MLSPQQTLSLVLEENRQKNFLTLMNAPYPDEFTNKAQMERWRYICKNYQKSRLVRFGNQLDFILVFYTWKGIDSLPIKTMSRKAKSAIYLQIFEGTYLQ
jgi:hypothetical protein